MFLLVSARARTNHPIFLPSLRQGYNLTVNGETIGWWLLAVGAMAVLTGGLIVLLSRTGLLGRLPGDIFFQRDGTSIYIPIATSLVISLVLTLIINLVLRLR